MRNFTRLSVLLTAIIFISILFSLGCQRPRVGTPMYQDPMADQSPYRPADEFKYLVDLDSVTQQLDAQMEKFGAGSGMPEELSMNPASILADLGIPDLEQKNITAEANESMVHAHGEYRLTGGTDTVLVALAENGSSEVKLPAHFAGDVWAGHFFLANPGNLIKMALHEAGISTDTASGETDPNLAMTLTMLGITDLEGSYSWMGAELLMFQLVNKGFDPVADPTYENIPFHQLFAISTDKPQDGLDVIENLSQGLLLALSGVTAVREPINDHDAIIFTLPSADQTMFGESMTEEQKEEYESLPDFAVAAVPGYIFISDRLSVEKALGLFDESTTGTGRMASLEAQWNWDLTIENFQPENLGALGFFAESPEVQDLLMRFYQATRDVGELGSSRASLLVTDGENFELDVLTSRESIHLFEIVRQVIEDTADEVWEEFGRQIGQALSEGAGEGPMDSGGGPAGGEKIPF